jgi:uncharacterized NAD(P)/FAD-binding protein YdhS
MPITIVIVGAGFSGTVLAANLLRRPPAAATDIVLIERGPAMGRGVAYAVRDFPYLLNVPAARLSADSRDPMQFLRFARRRAPDTDGEDFLPRARYGDYLQEVLSEAERDAPPHTRLVRIFGEARRLTRPGKDRPFAVEIADRAPITADRVILAVGTPPPALPAWAAGVREHAAYRHDPWELPKTLTAAHSVLIVGNGLTMADTALALTEDARRAPELHTISRRGLVPMPQTAFRPAAVRGDGEELLARADSLGRMAMIRKLALEVEDRGGDWREVVTFIRHLAPALWRRMPESERRRFVRHLQAHWDTHRHRLPPQMGARIASLRQSGGLKVNAGRILAVAAAGDQLRVTWRPRGARQTATLDVDTIVNATGPDYVLKRAVDPLLNSLRAAGLVSEDALNLGLRTAQYGACVDAQGSASAGLYYLGPMLRADHWEATAATELRDHAEQLAAHLAAQPAK